MYQFPLKNWLMCKIRPLCAFFSGLYYYSVCFSRFNWGFRWGFPYAAVHYRVLQRCYSYFSKDFSYDTINSVSGSAHKDLEWWISTTSLPTRSLYSFSLDISLSDSSSTVWGGWTTNNECTFDFWSQLESKLHVNILELEAVLILFQCFSRQSSNCSILIRTDSSTVVAYINKQGGSCSARLCLLALKLREFCIQRNLMIKAVHIPGIDNSKAAALSRMPSNDHSYFLPKMFLITFSQIFYFL